MSRLLDRAFRYVPAEQTDITATWRRFGFKPTTTAQRERQQGPKAEPVAIKAAKANKLRAVIG